MKLDTLYKFASDKKRINSWEIEIENNCYRTISGFVGMKQTVTEWTCCKNGKNTGKSNATTPEQQAIAEAEAIHRKRLEKGYVVDLTSLNSASKMAYFEPMLAKSWDDEKENIVYPIWSQPKLDGIRCIAKADGLWSRNNKAIVSAPHIMEALKPLFDKNPDLILDGEMYCDKLANDFNKICSIVKKTKPKPEDLEESKNVIEYHIYDIPSNNGKFSERFVYNESLWIDDKLSKGCKRVSTIILWSEEQIKAQYETYIGLGYEGQMLRVDGPYENKRSKYLLKHKSFIDEEYTILGVIEGEGNRSGMIGYMEFKNKDGKPFKSNVKANWDELKEMWINRDQLIGKQATIKYFQLTLENIPRFPYVIKIDRDSYE